MCLHNTSRPRIICFGRPKVEPYRMAFDEIRRRCDLDRWRGVFVMDVADVAARLGFLRRARRVTLEALAEKHQTQRSNLSSFINSRGQVRNVSLDKIDRILFDLGALPDGSLRSGLHRWRLDSSIAESAAKEILASDFQAGALFRLSCGIGSFLVVSAAGGLVQVFASLEPDVEPVLVSAFGVSSGLLKGVDLDRSGDRILQSLWLEDDGTTLGSALSAIVG